MSRSSTSIELAELPETVVQPPSLHLKGQDTPPLMEDTRPINPPANAVSAEPQDNPSKGTTAIVLVTVVCVTMITSMLHGMVTVTLPAMARGLKLDSALLLWCVFCIHDHYRLLIEAGQSPYTH
jgi:hypothetical protein